MVDYDCSRLLLPLRGPGVAVGLWGRVERRLGCELCRWCACGGLLLLHLVDTVFVPTTFLIDTMCSTCTLQVKLIEKMK